MKKKHRASGRPRTKHDSVATKHELTAKVTTPADERAQSTPSAEGVEVMGKPLRDVKYPETMPFDESLLERARTQWLFGDWASLAQLDRGTLRHHPDRAKLALLAAAGQLQQGDNLAARQFTRLAQDWGCSKGLISQILIAGVHNTLGRAASLGTQQQRALRHFEASIAVGSPGSEVRLLVQARVTEQFAQLGLSSENIRQLPCPPNHNDPEASYMRSLPSFSATLQSNLETLKADVKADISAEIRSNNPNPYAHNRTMTPVLNKALLGFAEDKLKLQGLKATYIDYLATKAIQIERNCAGRLATTVQDAVVRQLVAECVPGNALHILEIGALYGVSLAILYNHAITRFGNVRIVCLDPFDGYYGAAVDAVLNSPVNDLTFRRNMQLANVPVDDYSLIKHYSTDQAALAAAGKLSINLLVIDGDHSYDGVKFDFENYFPLLQPGGYVVFDDYNAKEWPGVQRFIDEDLGKVADLEYLGAFSRTAVARKRILAQA